MIFLVGTKEYSGINSLLVSQIVYLPLSCTLQGISCLIFTSKHAINSLLNSLDSNPALKNWHKLPTYAIGKGCENLLKKHNVNIAFIGENLSGVEFANSLLKILPQDATPLYLRAEKIVSNLDRILLDSNINLKQEIAYKNCPKKLDKSLKPPLDSILIFAAPSAYKAFVENFGWESSYKAVAIGQTTLDSLPRNIKAFKAKEHSLESCIQLAKELESKQKF